MYDISSTIPPLHLSQQSNVRGLIHHPTLRLLSQQSNVRHFIHHPPCSSTITIVKCTTLHPPCPLLIYPNSQMYDTSSTIPPLHLLSQQSNVRLFIHHPPCSSTIPVVKCTTLHPPCRLFIYYLNIQMYDTSSTIPPVHLLFQQSNVRHFIHHPPLFIYYPNSQMYDTSSTIPLFIYLNSQNVRHFIHHPPCSSTIPIVKCTTPDPPSPLFIYYPNSQMYDTSSTIPPLHLLSQQSNIRLFVHHPSCSSTIPIVKCTTLHPPYPLFIYLNSQMYNNSSTIPLFIYYPNTQMYDTSSTIPPVHLLSQQSNVRHLIHHTPFIYYPNSQMYDTSSTIPPFHLLSQQSNVRHFIHHPPVHLLSQQSNVRHLIHHPDSSSTIPIVRCTTLHPQSPLFIYCLNSQMYDTSSIIPPLFIYYPNSQMYDT